MRRRVVVLASIPALLLPGGPTALSLLLPLALGKAQGCGETARERATKRRAKHIPWGVTGTAQTYMSKS